MSFVRDSAIGTIPFLPAFACLIYFLLDATVFEEVAFLPFYEAADGCVALMDECDGYVGNGLVGAFLNLLAIDG